MSNLYDVLNTLGSRDGKVDDFEDYDRHWSYELLPKVNLDEEHEHYYMALQCVIERLIHMFEEDAFDELVDYEPNTYIDWAQEVVVAAEETQQRDGVSRNVVDELIKHAKFWGTKLHTFISNNSS